MATLVRWEPFREVAAMHNELSRLMNGLIEGSGREAQSWVPTLDVWETDTELVYAFDLPGIPQDKISVEVEDGALTVTAERERTEEVSKENFHRFERRFGTFSRTVGLPQGVSEDAIKASFKDGVLEIHVAKPEQPKPKRIEIAGGDASQPQTIEGTATQS
jgi:HSP20 family protein